MRILRGFGGIQRRCPVDERTRISALLPYVRMLDFMSAQGAQASLVDVLPGAVAGRGASLNFSSIALIEEKF